MSVRLLAQPAVESIGVDSMRRLVHGGFRQDKIIAGKENGLRLIPGERSGKICWIRKKSALLLRKKEDSTG